MAAISQIQTSTRNSTPATSIIILSHQFDQEWAAALNASFINTPLGGLGIAKFGAQVRLRSEGDLQSNYANPYPGPGLGSVVGNNPPITYYNKNYVLPPYADYGLLLSQVPLVGATSNPNDPNDPTGTAYANYQSNVSGFQHNAENVYAAGYGMENHHLRQTANAGRRPA